MMTSIVLLQCEDRPNRHTFSRASRSLGVGRAVRDQVSMGRGEASPFPGNRWCHLCLRSSPSLGVENRGVSIPWIAAWTRVRRGRATFRPL